MWDNFIQKLNNINNGSNTSFLVSDMSDGFRLNINKNKDKINMELKLFEPDVGQGEISACFSRSINYDDIMQLQDLFKSIDKWW